MDKLPHCHINVYRYTDKKYLQVVCTGCIRNNWVVKYSTGSYCLVFVKILMAHINMKVKNGCFFYIEISLSGATEGIVWSLQN